MASTPRSIAERLFVLEAARVVLGELSEDLTRCTEGEVAQVVRVADEVAARAGAVRVAAAVETARRSEVSVRELSSWAAEHAVSLRQGGAVAVAKVAVAVAAPSRAAGLCGGAPVEPDPQSPVGIVWAQVRAGSLQASNAVAVLVEEARLHQRLTPEAVPTVTKALVGLVVGHGPGTMRRLRPRLLARHGRHGELDTLQERLRPGVYLSTRFVHSADLTRYELAMTPEQAAVLEAAIGPMSAPHPNEETGEPDHRPAGQRRVEALTEVCRRSASTDADAAGSDGAAGSPSALHVTIALTDLQQGTGCAEILASAGSGTMLGPGSCAGSRVTRPWCRMSWAPTVRWSTRAWRCGCSPAPNAAGSGSGTAAAPTPAAPPPAPGAEPITCGTGPTQAPPTSTTPPCSANGTTPSSTNTDSGPRSTKRPDHHGRHVTWDLHHGSYDEALDQVRQREARRGSPEHATDDERRQAHAQDKIIDALRHAMTEHDERAQAAWYDLPIDEACPNVADAVA
ncbi:MAG: DUF222 domain-containing protein [Phycicoccus sp.]